MRIEHSATAAPSLKTGGPISGMVGLVRSLLRSQGRAASRATDWEQLEPRQLMGGDPLMTGPLNPASSGPAAVDDFGAWEALRIGQVGMAHWAGQMAMVKAGSYIARIDDGAGPLSAERAVALTNRLGTALGVTFSNVRSIARGRYAAFDSPVLLDAAKIPAAVAAVPGLAGVEPERVFQTQRVPNDPNFSLQYYHQNTGQNIGGAGTVGADIKSTLAWDITIGSRSTIVAVIDSGVDYTHPDLAANIYRNPGEIAGNGVDDDNNGFVDDVRGWDFGDLDNDPQDDIIGHGTVVSGVLGAVGNDGVGMAGVAWDISILPLKIADRFGLLVGSAIIASHDYTTMMRERGANVVASNNSYRGIGDQFYSNLPTGIDAERDAIERFIAAGGTFVASAGNDALDNDSNFRAYPASYNLPGIISVAATDNRDALAAFSNFGAETVDLAAPGVFTYSTEAGGGYSFPSGTSFSGPIVAGAVGLLRTLRPDASAVEVRKALIDSADPLPSLQNRVVSGGRLNVFRALQIIGLAGPTVRLVTPGPVSGQLDATSNPQTLLDKVVVSFSKPINATLLSTQNFRVVGAGLDDIFNTGDDVVIPVSGVAADPANPARIIATLNLTGFAGSRLPLDLYRLTVRHNTGASAQVRDTDGNLLNGNVSSGSDYVYDFRIVAPTGDFEPNDTLGGATTTAFDTSGTARFSGVTLGNGIFGAADVDLYRVQLPRGGQITAEVFAKRREVPSTLDSYLRLFNAAGEQIAANDQFAGSDSRISFFVSTGGVYYVGVSSFPNTNYDPEVGGSGSTPNNSSLPALYDLTIGTQLLDDDRLTFNAAIPGGGLRIPVDASGTATQGVTSTTFIVTDTRQIADLNVRLNLTHSFTSDLRMRVIAPNGRTVTLADRRGADGDNYTNTLFDDEAITPIGSASAPFTGSFKPDAPLSGFDGLSALGTWTLTIEDVAAFGTGTLLSASLEFTLSNDVFGPFESNDTLATATPPNFGAGGGTGRFDAFVGDGGFGFRDRDLYRITVAGGSTLNASVTPGRLPFGVTDPNQIVPGSDSLDSALRLFDAQGNELRLSSAPGTRFSRIENFVFATPGTYYLGVSESANTAYNPLDINSGAVSGTTGAYILEFTVSPGVSDPDVVVTGNLVSLGVATNGTFSSSHGASFGGTQFLYQTGINNPDAFFAAAAGGSTFRNDSLFNTQLPFVIADQSDTFNRRVVAKGSWVTGQGELRIERSMSFGVNDSFIAFDVFLTNATTTAISGVSWLEAFNPEQGQNLVPRRSQTSNDVLPPAGGSPRMAWASATSNAFPDGLTVAIAAADSQLFAPTARVLDPNLVVRDPEQVFETPLSDPNGALADRTLAMTFDVGTIPGGQTRRLRYFVMFGNSPAAVTATYAALNNGTGGGHLAQDSAAPASEVLLQPDGVTNVSLPQLPYRLYFPEGFSNAQTYTFVPVLNTSDQQTRVLIIARYEQNPLQPTLRRDQVLADLSLAPGQRSGITVTSPELYAANTLLSDKDRPYAVEIRAERPVAATFSHYDQFLLAGGRAAIGQAFTTRISSQWTFAEATKGAGVANFLLYMNTTGQPVKVDTTFVPQAGSGLQPFVFTQILEPYRRGGINFNEVPQLSNGTYGLVVNAQSPIVASLSHYAVPQAATGNLPSAYGYLGLPGSGSTAGAMPEGQFGLNSTGERLAVLNTSGVAATVDFEFVFANGTTYRSSLGVAPGVQRSLAVETLLNFPAGQPYSVRFTSNTPVTVLQPSRAFSNGLANTFADRAYSLWGFGEGFRPANNATNVVEYLRLYNPSSADTIAEITISYDNNLGEETFRVTMPARRVLEVDIHTLVTGERRFTNAFFGLTVKGQTPIVAYMGHSDPFFPGAFGTLGTPLGISAPLA